MAKIMFCANCHSCASTAESQREPQRERESIHTNTSKGDVNRMPRLSRATESIPHRSICMREYMSQSTKCDCCIFADATRTLERACTRSTRARVCEMVHMRLCSQFDVLPIRYGVRMCARLYATYAPWRSVCSAPDGQLVATGHSTDRFWRSHQTHF